MTSAAIGSVFRSPRRPKAGARNNPADISGDRFGVPITSTWRSARNNPADPRAVSVRHVVLHHLDEERVGLLDQLLGRRGLDDGAERDEAELEAAATQVRELLVKAVALGLGERRDRRACRLGLAEKALALEAAFSAFSRLSAHRGSP